MSSERNANLGESEIIINDLLFKCNSFHELVKKKSFPSLFEVQQHF